MGFNDINLLLDKYRKFFYSKCNNFSEANGCQREGGCACRTHAEMWSYIDYVVPEEYARLSLRQFTGFAHGERTVSDEVINGVRRKVWNYCFGNNADLELFMTEILTRTEMDKASLMDERHAKGANLVIHGQQSFSNNGKVKTLAKGKTMLASIVMMEAIRRKLFDTNNATTFNFENFALLKKHLKDRDAIAENIREADWLVIDDISINPHATGTKMSQYLTEVLDEFFMYRLENKLPSILVFAFDIDNYNLVPELGYGISKLVSSSNTHIIKV